MNGLIDVSCIKVEQQQEEDTIELDISDIDIGPIKIELERYETTKPTQEKLLPATATK